MVARVLPSELVNDSLRRELSGHWGAGELRTLRYGGVDVDALAVSWDALGVEDGAILRADWRPYLSLSDENIGDAVAMWCDPARHDEARTTYGQIADWKVSSVTNMKALFKGQADFNGDLSLWDCSRVTDTSECFDGCHNFNKPLGRWDMSNVTDTRYVLQLCMLSSRLSELLCA